MNSQYTGEQVDSLLTQVSGKTIYTQGDGISISDEGVISSTGGGGSTDTEKKAWVGTETEYNALSDKDSDRLYIITE